MDKKKALSTMGKAAVSAIPFVGGSIASLWSDLESSQIERKISRFVGLVETLQSDFEVIKDKVNQDFVSASENGIAIISALKDESLFLYPTHLILSI